MKYTSATGFLFLVLISGLPGCSKKSSPGTGGGNSDSATVTVLNGYGSGRYKTGDTVDIWSQTIPSGSVFDSWSGYNSLLENTGEWHNRFIMPSQDVTVTAALKSLAPFTLKYEKIRGMNILKNVYYYFPAGHKGIVYLLHGTGGSAQNLVNNFEWIQMINDLVASGYAIIVTEAEEVSLNTDLNGDGSIHWTLTPADTLTNPDYRNIRVLTDTFYNRGYSSPSIPLYSIGMSNGGAFSSALSYLYKFAAGISYCAPATNVVVTASTTPLQFCMAKYDNASEVGPAGNTTAQANSAALTGRGICSKIFIHDHSPAYPQRWARWSGISLSLSTSLYNELKANHWLDAKNYLVATSDVIDASIQANPSTYPVSSSLGVAQYQFFLNEIDVMYAAHQFYSDYDKATIRFLKGLCQ